MRPLRRDVRPRLPRGTPVTLRNMTGRGWLVLAGVWVGTVTLGIVGVWLGIGLLGVWAVWGGIAIMLSAGWWPWFQKGGGSS